MIILPEYAYEIIDTLKEAGYEAFAVGGCTRNALMGIPASDIDITTSAYPEDIAALFPKTAFTGRKYGTVTVYAGGGKAEVTTFRTEEGYADFRRPDTVSFTSSITEDLKRRDFTMNTVCVNKTGVFDPYNGIGDISDRIIRCVGDADKRFSEDALRILRAFRFAAEYGFEIENNTLEAALSNAPLLTKISAERIRDELLRILLSDNPSVLSPLIDRGGLSFLGIDDGSDRDISLISSLPHDLPLRLAAFLIIFGIDAYGNAVSKLRLSNSLKSDVRTLIRLCKLKYGLTKYEIKKAVAGATPQDYLNALKINLCLSRGNDYSYINDMTEKLNDIIFNNEPYNLRMLAVSGDDLIREGFKKSPGLGGILNKLLDCVMQNPDNNKYDKLILIAKAEPTS